MNVDGFKNNIQLHSDSSDMCMNYNEDLTPLAQTRDFDDD